MNDTPSTDRQSIRKHGRIFENAHELEKLETREAFGSESDYLDVASARFKSLKGLKEPKIPIAQMHSSRWKGWLA